MQPGPPGPAGGKPGEMQSHFAFGMEGEEQGEGRLGRNRGHAAVVQFFLHLTTGSSGSPTTGGVKCPHVEVCRLSVACYSL